MYTKVNVSFGGVLRGKMSAIATFNIGLPWDALVSDRQRASERSGAGL